MKLFATLLALAAFSLIAQGVGKYLAYTWAMPPARAGALRIEPASQSRRLRRFHPISQEKCNEQRA